MTKLRGDDYVNNLMSREECEERLQEMTSGMMVVHNYSKGFRYFVILTLGHWLCDRIFLVQPQKLTVNRTINCEKKITIKKFCIVIILSNITSLKMDYKLKHQFYE